jgi:hypothetical protein
MKASLFYDISFIFPRMAQNKPGILFDKKEKNKNQ